MSVYKLYGSGVADALASLDIQYPGTITGILFASVGTLNADGEDSRAELSFASTSGFGSNDTRASIAAVRQQFGLLTSGAGACGINVFVGPLEVPVSAGERLYLHTAGTSFVGGCHIYVRDGNSVGRSVRSRQA